MFRFHQWIHETRLQAKSHIDSGNIEAIIDPLLDEDYDLQSVWKITEVAIACVRPHGIERPSISEVLKEIQEAIAIEQASGPSGENPISSKYSMGSSVNLDPLDLGTPDRHVSITGVFGGQPGLRWLRFQNFIDVEIDCNRGLELS